MKQFNINGSIYTKQSSLSGTITTGSGGGKNIHTDSTANWNAQPQLIAKKDHLYIYTDYEVIEGTAIPAMKIGDGMAYLIDLPFIDGNMNKVNNHINNGLIHVSAEDRMFWDNKVTCFISADDETNLVFTKNREE